MLVHVVLQHNMVQDQRKPEAHNSCLTTAGAAASGREEKRRSNNSVKQFRHSFLKRRRQQEVCCCCTVAQMKGLSQSQAALWLLLFFSFHNSFGLDEISEIFHPTFQPELRFICLSCTSRCVFSYDGLLLQDRPLQVSLLPELCSHRQRHLEGRTQRAQN